MANITILIVLTLSFPGDDHNTEECIKTLQGHECIFPFTYFGIEYTTCNAEEIGYDPWCAYQVNSHGKMELWDYCGEPCGKR